MSRKRFGARALASCVLAISFVLGGQASGVLASIDSPAGQIRSTTADGGCSSYGGGTFYGMYPVAVYWTDCYLGYYFYQGTSQYVTGQNQGGCMGANIFQQAVTGTVTYYWPGGSRGPINSTDVNPHTVTCQYFAWGNGDTYNSPYVLFFTWDAHDWAHIASTWFCGAACFPNTFGGSRDYYYR